MLHHTVAAILGAAAQRDDADPRCMGFVRSLTGGERTVHERAGNGRVGIGPYHVDQRPPTRALAGVGKALLFELDKQGGCPCQRVFRLASREVDTAKALRPIIGLNFDSPADVPRLPPAVIDAEVVAFSAH